MNEGRHFFFGWGDMFVEGGWKNEGMNGISKTLEEINSWTV